MVDGCGMNGVSGVGICILGCRPVCGPFDSNSGHQLLFPPANLCPISTSWTTQGYVVSGRSPGFCTATVDPDTDGDGNPTTDPPDPTYVGQAVTCTALTCAALDLSVDQHDAVGLVIVSGCTAGGVLNAACELGCADGYSPAAGGTSTGRCAGTDGGAAYVGTREDGTSLPKPAAAQLPACLRCLPGCLPPSRQPLPFVAPSLPSSLPPAQP